MFKFVHHVHYTVRNMEEALAFAEKAFGIKPDSSQVRKDGKGKEAVFSPGETQMHLLEPAPEWTEHVDFLKVHGPGIHHVAWVVEDVEKMQVELVAKGNTLRHGNNPTKKASIMGYPIVTVEDTPLGQHLQMTQVAKGGANGQKAKGYMHHIRYVVANLDKATAYLEHNFALKPQGTWQREGRWGREAIYKVGRTLMEIEEPGEARAAAMEEVQKHGPYIEHVGWGVENIDGQARDLVGRGVELQYSKNPLRSHLAYYSVTVAGDGPLGKLVQFAADKRQA